MYEAMFKYVSIPDFRYCPIKFANHSNLNTEVKNLSNCLDNCKKTVSFVDMVHGIDGDELATHVVFNGGNTFYLWIGSHQPKCITSDDQFNFSNDDEHTSNIILENYVLLDMGPTAAFPLTHSSDRDFMTIQNPRESTHQQKTD